MQCILLRTYLLVYNRASHLYTTYAELYDIETDLSRCQNIYCSSECVQSFITSSSE